MLAIDSLPADVKHEFVLTLAAILETDEVTFRRLFVRVGAEVFLRCHHESVDDIVDRILENRQRLADEFEVDLATAEGDFADMQVCETKRGGGWLLAHEPAPDSHTRVPLPL